MAKFEIVSKYKDQGLILPKRETAHSAGYDFRAAADVIIPPSVLNNISSRTVTLEEQSEYTKMHHIRPTLIPTGIKCKLGEHQYLELCSRSSSPLKYLLFCANSVGIIDADYYGNDDNEGEIFFQAINLSPNTIHIQKGDKICQGIIHTFDITEDDNAAGKRTGGFGSTSKKES